MAHIFISYSHEDSDYATILANALDQAGFAVWLDERIEYGARWFNSITQAIRNSAAVVVIMTPAAEQSEWVEKEILLAQKYDKPLFPLLLEGREFDVLITTQYVDVTDGNLPTQKFYNRLARVVSPHKMTITSSTFNLRATLRSKLNEPWAIIIGALISGLFVVVSALILRPSSNSADGNQALSSTLTFTSNPTETTTLTDVPTATYTQLSTLAATPTLSEAAPPTVTLTPTYTATIKFTATVAPSNSPHSTITPTNMSTATDTAAITSTPKPRSYPCEAKIVFSPAELLDVIRAGPSSEAPSRDPIRQGSPIIILNKVKELHAGFWYQITTPSGEDLGWIPLEYVDPSETCPD